MIGRLFQSVSQQLLNRFADFQSFIFLQESIGERYQAEKANNDMKFVTHLFDFTTYYKALLLISFISLLCTNMYALHEIYFSKIGVEEGLAQLTVMTIFEDELGNMWFGTREGVSVYNGTSMRNIQPKQSYENVLSGNVIRNIQGDLNGSVYIHTQNGVDKYDLRSEKISNLVKMQVNAINCWSDDLWFAKNNKIFNYHKDKEHPFAEIDNHASITVIKHVSDNRIMVGTLSSGLYEVDSLGRSKCLIAIQSRVSAIYEDSNKNIWIGTWEEGLFKIDQNGEILNLREDHKLTSQKVSSNFVRTICEDDSGTIWVGTKLGLDKLENNLSPFSHYDSKSNDQKSLSYESIWSLYKDRYGNIWIGTYYGGVNFFNPESDLYNIHDLQKGAFSGTTFPVISQIIEYDDHTLLICTEGNGLIKYNIPTKTYMQFDDLKYDNIKSAYLNKENGTLYLGLHLGGLAVLDLKSGQTKRYPVIQPDLNQSNIIRKIIPYQEKFLIATYNGLYLFDESRGDFAVFSTELHQYLTYFIDIDIDRNHNLWIASRGLYKYHIPSRNTTPYFSLGENVNSLSNNNVTKVYVDDDHKVWLGTAGGGVNYYDPESDKFTVFNSLNSDLNNDYISNLTKANSGNLYITTTQGLSILNKEKDKVINLNYGGGFPLNSLYNGGIMVSSREEIFVAGMNGMVSFMDQQILNELHPINLRFSNLWVNNRKVSPHDETGLLRESLAFTPKIKLKHSQSIVRLEFSSDNLLMQNKYQYLYKMDGLSDQWLTLRDGIKEIDLININPGKYQLALKAVSPYADTTLGYTELDLYIAPPFYKSMYAYFLYFLIFLFLLYWYMRYLKDKIMLKTSLEFEKKEREHLEEVNQMKLQFFTNISHEFRTPLTLISSQTDILLQNKRLEMQTYDKIKSIDRNAKMMQQLINELLDFRKAVNEKLSIRVEEHELIEFVKDIHDSFAEYAAYRLINFRMDVPDEQILLWFDPLQMQKVLFNLISNAFKFTPEGGNITIAVKQGGNRVSVSVEDTGAGISKQDIDKIFERFYQADNNTQHSQAIFGTGLGLALTKLIVNAHHAALNVTSEPGRGSRFEVVLQKGFKHFGSQAMLSNQNRDEASKDEIKNYLFDFKVSDAPIDDSDKAKSAILIVEDNQELLQLLKSLFDKEYRVITAINGEEGLIKTIENQPDLVLSDWMMPIMDGAEMCLKIKSNFAVCHIPVILLTAKTGIEHNIESLKLGADDYISKPFNVSHLLARCNNLINGRKLLQEKFIQSGTFSSQSVASNELDVNFLEQANQVIEANIENPDFNINEFSKQMNLSRTTLFNKIKGVTGQTPNEFIINLKMKKATFLLIHHPELNISDITYQLGFNSPKYFSKCFKDQFGMTPTEFRSVS